jgi:hypothetical protein
MKSFKMKLLVAMIATLPITAFAGPHGQSAPQRHHEQHASAQHGERSSHHARYEGRGRYAGHGRHEARGRYEGRHAGGHGVNQRQLTQKRQIQQGVRSGQLTPQEARGLRQEQKGIRKEERAYRSDGEFTRAERRDVRQDQRALSQHIYQEKHDDDTRNRVAMRDPGVNQRQRNEQHRIAQGARTGELTRDEAKDLRSDQRDIRQEERAYKSDGKLTRDERQDLHRDQNAASRNIYAEKHDDDRR